MTDPLDYWELSEKKRSQLTREEVEKFTDYELMKNGVVKVPVPVLQPIAEITVKQTLKYRAGRHESDGPCFDTAELARTYISLNPKKWDYNYSMGDKFHYFEPLAERIEIYPVEAFTKDDYESIASILKMNKAATEYNDEAQREYKKSTEGTANTLGALWKDYFDCVELANKHQRVLKTRAEYVATAGGNTETAERFLEKAFSADVIHAADEWAAQAD